MNIWTRFPQYLLSLAFYTFLSLTILPQIKQNTSQPSLSTPGNSAPKALNTTQHTATNPSELTRDPNPTHALFAKILLIPSIYTLLFSPVSQESSYYQTCYLALLISTCRPLGDSSTMQKQSVSYRRQSLSFCHFLVMVQICAASSLVCCITLLFWGLFFWLGMKMDVVLGKAVRVALRPINDGLGLGRSGTCALFLDRLFLRGKYSFWVFSWMMFEYMY